MTRWPGASEDSQLLADVVGRFAREQLAPLLVADTPGEFGCEGAIQRLIGSGFWAIALSGDCGGDGADLGATSLAVAELSAASAFLGFLVGSVSMLGGLDPGDSGRTLSRLAVGGHVAIVDTSSPLVRTEMKDDGRRLHLQAEALTDAHGSLAALVLSDGSPLLIEPDAWTRMSCRGHSQRMGLRELPSCDVDWEGSARTVLPEQGARSRARWQLMLAAVTTGIVSAGAAESSRYAGERNQFGRPIVDFGGVAAMVRNLSDKASQMRMQLLAIATAIETSNDACDWAIGAARALRRGAVALLVDAIQVHGGYGYINEYPVERLLRDATTVRAIGAPGAVRAVARISS